MNCIINNDNEDSFPSTIAQENGYGFWAASNSVEAFGEAVDRMLRSDIQAMGERGYEFFSRNYTVEHSFETIMGHLK